MLKVLQGSQNMLAKSIFLLIIYLTSVSGQCTEVSSTEDPSNQICASLHLYEDNNYYRRLVSASPARNDWIFTAVSSDVFVDLYDCWVLAIDTNETFPILNEGCKTEHAYYVDKGESRRGAIKFYGHFLQLTPDIITRFRIQCEVSTDCPAASDCTLLCTRDSPRKYLLSSIDIEIAHDTSSSTTTDSEILIIALIVVGAVIFLIFLILLVILVCMWMRKRRRRRHHGHDVPILTSNTSNEHVYQNGSSNGTSAENPGRSEAEVEFSSGDVYATVRKESKYSKTQESEM